MMIIIEKKGYDVESIGERGEEIRFIEVKGRSDKSPSITITANEFETLVEKKNSYVYVVSNSLIAPVLKILDGESLVKISKRDVRFQFGDWEIVQQDSYDILKLIDLYY